ncbi:MAG: hypothetical protein IJV39_05595 [Ruminococcus sp.]|nr:hypothetical protein [Ruminococcus sp.]
MKKLSAILLSAVILSSLTSSAFADEWNYYDYNDDYDSYSDDYTDSYDDYNSDYNNGYTNDDTLNDRYNYIEQTTVPVKEEIPKKPSALKAVKTFKANKTLSGTQVKSSADNECAVLNKGAKQLLLDGVKITSNGALSYGESYAKYYGLGSALLTTNGTTYVKNGGLICTADFGSAVFSYSKGTAFLAGTKISSEKNSYGVAVAGGEVYGYNLNINAKGNATAINGSNGGKIILDGGKITDSANSVVINANANIALHDIDLTAEKSAIADVSGKNTLSFFECNLNSAMKGSSAYAFAIQNSVEKSGLNIVDCTLTNKKGGVFLVDNAKAAIVLSNTKISYSKSNDYLLNCEGASDCSFTADNQKISGKILREPNSKLNVYLKNKSSFSGKIQLNNVNSYDEKKCNVYIDANSTWVVTGNSTVSTIYNKGKITDKDGNVVSIKALDGTQYAQGKSKYTVTVENYLEKESKKGFAKTPAWSDNSKKAPEVLGLKTEIKSNETIDNTQPSSTKKSNNSKEKTLNINQYYLYIGIILVAVIILVVVYIFTLRRKKSQ